VDATRKRELLAHLVKSGDWRQVLVFCRTKHGANRLAQQLERDGIEADAIHGNKSQNARVRALEQFKANELRVLVATDIAARGLDIEALPHVVNYDMPHVAEDYVHRIGRTGRAGVEGEAVSLVSNEERSLMAAIERLINRKVEHKIIAGFEPGSASHRAPAEHKRPPQRHAEQRRQRPQGQGRNARPENRNNRPERHKERPTHAPRAPHAPHAVERDAQIREARARMEAEGEKPSPVSPNRQRGPRPTGALLGGKRPTS
jgi:ATP-dependent RNA helicase RhlE